MVASGREAEGTCGGGAVATINVRACDEESPKESVSVTVIGNDPDAVGVPEICKAH
jgi:hypothetical protein